MTKENWDIQFIKPCRYPVEEHRILTPEYAIQALLHGKIVQINLDNCSIQRMENLSEYATLGNVEEVGLLPLYEILQKGIVSLTCIGVNEMPDWRVENAHVAYERFCRKFWPGHRNDKDATHRQYDPNSKDRKVRFKELKDGARCTYGCAYVAILQIQNIKLRYQNFSIEKQFEIYIYSMTYLLDMVSGFELEIAKYAFWALDNREINQLTPVIKQRRKDIRENFAKAKSSLDKCREFAFDAAMDLHWLSGANLSEDLGHDIEIDGVTLKLDNWVGTNDHKLYRISRDIHSTPFDGSTMKRLAITRETELGSIPYWKNVDALSREVLRHRHQAGYSNMDDLLKRIDNAVMYLEEELDKVFCLEEHKNT